MPLTREDVSRAYSTVLGRLPENEAVIDHTLSREPDMLELVDALMRSVEYRARLDPYRGHGDSDIDLLRRHLVTSEPRDGFVTDFLGSRTDTGFNSHLAHLGGMVEGLPVPASFHAEAVEWVGTLRAVEEADEGFAVAEIGAGWGPWLVASGVAARRLGKSVFMAGVEADPGHYASMVQHLGNNGFNPGDHRLLQGAIGPVDGFAFFPNIDSAGDWGAAAVFQTSETAPTSDYRGHPLTYSRVPAFSMATALHDREMFDLVHIDIQGSERELLPACAGLLKTKVRRIVLGTHSRAIEGEVIELFNTDWILENEKPCRFDPTAEQISAKQTLIDGAQVWRNRNL